MHGRNETLYSKFKFQTFQEWVSKVLLTQIYFRNLHHSRQFRYEFSGNSVHFSSNQSSTFWNTRIPLILHKNPEKTSSISIRIINESNIDQRRKKHNNSCQFIIDQYVPQNLISSIAWTLPFGSWTRACEDYQQSRLKYDIQYQIIRQTMEPFALYSSTQIPLQAQNYPPFYQLCYFPSAISFPIDQSSLVLNLYEASLLNSQFQQPSQVPSTPCPVFAATLGLNHQNSRNEVRNSEEAHSDEQLIMPKEKLKQKFGRNIKSNIFGSMLRFVKKQRSLKAHARRIIQKRKLTIKITDFYYLLNKKLKNLKAYLTQSDIAAFFDDEIPAYLCESAQRKEREFRIVFRILHRLYLNYYHLPYLYSTRKIKDSSKRVHLQYIRQSLRL